MNFISQALPSRVELQPGGGCVDRVLATTTSTATLRAGASVLLHVRGLAAMNIEPVDWIPPGGLCIEPARYGFLRLRSHLTRDLGITITKHWRLRGGR